ncbi:HAD-IIIA family hydrolase [Prochlorococcus sp. AH-716-P08]|nr:HAD-IIIA family hydrolase [Prochlorococcus sp. AH-716-P08]
MQNKNKFKIIYKPNRKNNSKKSPVLFLDRDGVIIEDVHYINDPNKVKLCLGARKLIRKFYENNIAIVIITNQSGISKGLITWADYISVTKSMIEKLGNPNPISAIYANSHLSELPRTNWRKPNPNMIFQAITDLNLDIKKSILIGDRGSDILAGINAGIENIISVETGYGLKEKNKILKILNEEINYPEKKSSQNIFFIENLTKFPYELLKIEDNK